MDGAALLSCFFQAKLLMATEIQGIKASLLPRQVSGFLTSPGKKESCVNWAYLSLYSLVS